MGTANSPQAGLTRRSFLKTTGLAAGSMAMASLSGCANITLSGESGSSDDEVVVTTTCRNNCFQVCLLEAHVRDGKLRYMTRGDYPEDVYSGCCVKGLSIPERTYSSTRIKYPMRRKGERGSDEWERISWDEAIEEIASKFKEIREEFGPRAIALEAGSGNYGAVQGANGLKGLFGKTLEATALNICYDEAFGYGTDRVIGGGIWCFSNEPTNMLDSRHILVWGANPVSAQPQTWRIAQFAKERGAKVTCIDPMYSTTASRSDEYIAILPGTDVMVACAILNEIVSNDRIDVEYVKAQTNATFLIRKDNGLLLRRSDIEGGPQAEIRDAKTLNTAGQMADDPALVWDVAANAALPYTECKQPVLEGKFEVNGISVETVYSGLKKSIAEYTVERAAEMSQIPEDKIREIVRYYTDEGPVFLYSVYGIDHYRNGHLFSQTMAVVHALTNNISRVGCSVGGSGGLMLQKLPQNWSAFAPKSKKVSYGGLPQADFANVLVTGKHNGKDFPIKALFCSHSNAMSNFAQQNLWFEKILPNLDYIVTIDTEFTDTARYSDIVLPVAFWTEYNDVRVNNYANPFVCYLNKCIDPLYESKLESEIYYLICEKLGLSDDFPLKPSEEWIADFLNMDGLRAKGITPETLKEQKAIRGIGSPDIPFVRGFEGSGFPTPSGRAEIYKELPLPRVDYGQDWQSAAKAERFPTFVPPTENWPESPQRQKYPISYLQTHERWRTHSQCFAVSTLNELCGKPVAYISAEDARKRNIENGDTIEVFNDRGAVTIEAAISSALPENVLDIPKGWQMNQTIAGGYQSMTGTEVDPMNVNFAYFDALVDIRKKGE